ncbi:MAG: hypothetical protein EBQ85_06790 [Proteobacteria bacterium]|nr:hypothetical protein [Pseudomonadota bacterium]
MSQKAHKHRCQNVTARLCAHHDFDFSSLSRRFQLLNLPGFMPGILKTQMAQRLHYSGWVSLFSLKRIELDFRIA